MNLKLLLTISLALLTLQKATCRSTHSETDSIKYLAYAVAANEYDREYRWMHRAILYKAAGVDLRRDTGKLLSQRMQLFWQQHSRDTVSQAWEEPVLLHQLLRHAIANENGVLLLDAIRWGIDINRVDTATRQTLLNFLEEEYRNYRKQGEPSWLREYKQILVMAGGKYFAEVDYRMRLLAKKYERIRPAVNGLFAVRKKGRWGWVNENNQVIIPLQYRSVRYSTDNLFEVSDDGEHYYFVDRKNRRSPSL
jgi:hypothetical protein